MLETQHTPFPDDFRRIYMDEKRNGQDKLTNVHTALKIIRALLNATPRVHIVVDGLDECVDRQDFALRRAEFHKVMKELMTYSYNGIVKLLFSSRHEIIFEKLFTKPARVIEVTQEHTATDITVFLNDNGYVWGDEEDGIVHPIITGGNFLDAALELSTQNYAGVTCEEELKEAQWQYKPGLIYDEDCRSLEMLAGRSPQEKRPATRLFVFVATFYQPITINELRDALAVEAGTDKYSLGRRPLLDKLKELWTPFLRLDRTPTQGSVIDNPFVVFVHNSAREFLRQNPSLMDPQPSPRCWEFFTGGTKQCHEELGRVCLTYHSYNHHCNSDDILAALEKGGLRHSFYTYSAVFWYQHLSEDGITPTEDLFRDVSNFLRSCSFLTCIRVQSKYAPYLFARLTTQEGLIWVMKSTAAVYRPNPKNDYYSDAIPRWVEEFGPEGKYLSHSYVLFVKEFGVVLLLRPGEIKPCHLGLLGTHNFFSMKQWRTHENRCIILTSNQKSAYNNSMTSREELLLAVKPTSTGVIAWCGLTERPESEPVLFIHTKKFQLSFPGSDNSGSNILKLEGETTWAMNHPDGQPGRMRNVLTTTSERSIMFSLGYKCESIFTAPYMHPDDSCRQLVRNIWQQPDEKTIPNLGLTKWVCIGNERASRRMNTAVLVHFTSKPISACNCTHGHDQSCGDGTSPDVSDDDSDQDDDERTKPEEILGISSVAIFDDQHNENPQWFHIPTKGIAPRAVFETGFDRLRPGRRAFDKAWPARLSAGFFGEKAAPACGLSGRLRIHEAVIFSLVLLELVTIVGARPAPLSAGFQITGPAWPAKAGPKARESAGPVSNTVHVLRPPFFTPPNP
ncbi:hypothetical protein BDD12DRAFT_943883 [Trichophaea hybrida]|nr:hypothetical protein BDD12DRAFT_943883 [Trichophaea hybrida]